MTSLVPAPAPRVTVAELTLVRPAALKLSVRGPGAPAIARSVKVARPWALVGLVLMPVRFPPPVAIAAVIETLELTGLPAPSATWIAGCCANGTPLWAELEGCVAMMRRAAAPAESAMDPDTAEVSPDAAKVSV